MRVGVVGCGVAGQAASILLADAGHQVTIFERFAEPRPIGAGLLLQPTGLAVLRDTWPADARWRSGARVVGLEGRTHRGRSVLDSLCRPASPGLLDSASGAACCSTCCTLTSAALAGEAGHRRGRSSMSAEARSSTGGATSRSVMISCTPTAHSACARD
jgi:hypothetical protein